VDQAGPDPDATIRANARIQAGLLGRASPVLRDLVARGTLKIVAGHYDIGSGEVTVLG
jgi:carbonic anhydrase